MTAVTVSTPTSMTSALRGAFWFAACSAWAVFGWLLLAPQPERLAAGPVDGYLYDYQSPGFALAVVAGGLGLLAATLLYVLRNIDWFAETTLGEDYRPDADLFARGYAIFGTVMTLLLLSFAVDAGLAALA
jgi:hypothetical protein